MSRVHLFMFQALPMNAMKALLFLSGDIVKQSKRRHSERTNDCVPKLIDNMRRHMGRQLSSLQREQILLREAKEDSQFKWDIT